MTPDEAVPNAAVIIFRQRKDTSDSWLHAALSRERELEVVEVVTSVRAAVAGARDRQPQAVIVDAGTDDMASHGVLAAIRGVAPNAHIVLSAGVAGAHDAPGARRWLSRITAAFLDPQPDGGLDARLTLSSEPRAVPVARAFVTDLLTAWQLQDDVEPIGLVTSELVANAALHVGGPCALELTCQADVVRVAVADADPTHPSLQAFDPASERGRGLQLVTAFSSSWGVDPLSEAGKVVWAQLDRTRIGTP